MTPVNGGRACTITLSQCTYCIQCILIGAAWQVSSPGKDGGVCRGTGSGECGVKAVHRPCEHPSFVLPSPSATAVTSAATSAGDSSDTPSAASGGTPRRRGKIPPVPLFSVDTGSGQGCDTSEQEDGDGGGGGEVMDDAEDGGGEVDQVDQARSRCRHNQADQGDRGRSCGCFETSLRGRFRRPQQQQQDEDPRLDLHLRSPLHLRSKAGDGGGAKECVDSDGGGCESSSGRSTPVAPRSGSSSAPRRRRPPDEAEEDMEEAVTVGLGLGLDGKGGGRRGVLPTVALAASAPTVAPASTAAASASSSSRTVRETAFGSGASESDGDRDSRIVVDAVEVRSCYVLSSVLSCSGARENRRRS